MLRFVVPFLLVVLGGGAGAALGLYLRPEAPPVVETAPPPSNGPRDFVRLPNQFVVPVMDSGRVGALVVLSLSLEVDSGQAAEVHAVEPKLRDELLRVLFEHANTGGFRGAFTEANRMVALRRTLLEPTRKIVPSAVHDILITEILRQDN